MRLVPGQAGPSAVPGPEPVLVEDMGQLPCATSHVRVGQATVPEDDAVAIGHPGGDRLVDLGQVVLRHGEVGHGRH